MRDFVNLTPENLETEHLCCIIRTKIKHPGVEAKRKWLSARLREGHVFRKLDVKGTVFVEYAPLEKAWVPVVGENYLYLYCLWVLGEHRGKGYASNAVKAWEHEMKQQGFKMALISTQVDESAQHFYRKLGYVDCGGITFHDTPFHQPMELFLRKVF